MLNRQLPKLSPINKNFSKIAFVVFKQRLCNVLNYFDVDTKKQLLLCREIRYNKYHEDRDCTNSVFVV